jgi:hypothetical protein
MKHLAQNGFWFAKTSELFSLNRLAMMLVFIVSVTACNKEDFYQKDYLNNPNSDDTVETTGGSNGGDTSGVDGSAQGGVDAGVTSGTTDGTTGGSSTGDTTGGATTGSVSGGTTTGGTTTGGTTTGGTTTGGTTTGGTTTGGTTTGGTTTGDTTGGSTTGGTTTGGTTGGATYEDVTESFNQTAEETKKVDIMWVIDDSGSMADEQTALGDNFDSFITQFINMDVDFKMGITTTDTSSDKKKGKMVTGSDTKLTSAAAAANPNQFMSDFKSLVQVGTGGSGYEKGLAATEGFMDKYAASFIRPDAYLAVVVLSDEEDQSPELVKYYTDYLKAFKSNAGLVKIYSIVNVNDVNTGGNTIGHARYQAASEQTAGVMSNIMDDFADVLLDMGKSIVNLLDSFALAAAPVDGTLKVYVNGVETSNYTYDSASHSIKFDAGNLPPVGAQVTVKYKKLM